MAKFSVFYTGLRILSLFSLNPREISVKPSHQFIRPFCAYIGAVGERLAKASMKLFASTIMGSDARIIYHIEDSQSKDVGASF